MATSADRYIREVLHSVEAPPAIPVRYFYTSPVAIDDPLSPLPPPATGASSARRHPPRPFSEYDNEAIEKSWLDLRKKILKHNEEVGEKASGTGTPPDAVDPALARLKRKRGESASGSEMPGTPPGRDIIPAGSFGRGGEYSRSAEVLRDSRLSSSAGLQGIPTSSPLRPREDSVERSPVLSPTITGTPFIRAPSRKELKYLRRDGSTEAPRRPTMHETDSYNWDDGMDPALHGQKDKRPSRPPSKTKADLSAKVPVGVSRLHHVVMDAQSFRMEPIYWSPVNDIAAVVRGTWFYKESMLPVEVDVANMLEAGYLDLKAWTQTWKDELDSAIEVGAVGEMKILHKLWPQKSKKKSDSRPVSSAQMQAGLVQSTLPEEELDPESERRAIVENACDLIDISTGPNGPDNKAAGDTTYSHDGRKRLYRDAGVIYADEKEAYLLRPSLQPSDYYGRRPLANYIRKGRSIGVRVVRGFDQALWDKLHPSKKTPIAMKAREGVSSAQAGIPPQSRQKLDPELALSERPQVTDLVFVIHGIGQKLSERIETFHFTHAINAFRRDVNVELGAADVKRHLRQDAGGIMVLPVRKYVAIFVRMADSRRSIGANA